MRLFVYGTLLDDALVLQLTGRRFSKSPAVLAGYRKYTPPGGYPYIIADDAAEVAGAVLDGVDAEALRAFDHYEDEGSLYHRVEVSVSRDGEMERVFVYVAAKGAR